MTAEALTCDVERHERAIYGGNGNSLGMLARIANMETFVDEIRMERKEAKGDRRKIMVAVVTAAIITLASNIVTLILTHPALQAAGSATIAP
jgi:hypothetical protein